jgi:hypothetical protein
MSFAPRARLSAAPEDLQATTTGGNIIAVSKPLEQVSPIEVSFLIVPSKKLQASSQPSQDVSVKVAKSAQDGHWLPGKPSVSRRTSSLAQRRSSVQPATRSTQSTSEISSQDVGGTSVSVCGVDN